MIMFTSSNCFFSILPFKVKISLKCVNGWLPSTCSEIDNDAYCLCTHDFSPCTHRNIRPVHTMYAVKISGTQTVYDLMRTQIKIPLKLSQNDNLSTSIVRLLCQQSKRMQLLIVSYYIPCNILCIFSSYTINVYSVQCLLTKGLFMNLLVVCHIWFIE